MVIQFYIGTAKYTIDIHRMCELFRPKCKPSEYAFGKQFAVRILKQVKKHYSNPDEVGEYIQEHSEDLFKVWKGIKT